MSSAKATHITWHDGQVSPADREALLGQRGCVVWLTGLSGSGKSTLAHALEHRLIQLGHPTYVLDGDNVRHGLNGDLGFSPADREENIRRIGQVAALFADAGLITLVAFISPYRAGRDAARQAAGEGRFLEVYVEAPLDACRQRDPKGLYRQADAGEIRGFTGIDAPYEPPLHPELTLRTDRLDPAACVESLENTLRARGLLGSRAVEDTTP